MGFRLEVNAQSRSVGLSPLGSSAREGLGRRQHARNGAGQSIVRLIRRVDRHLSLDRASNADQAWGNDPSVGILGPIQFHRDRDRLVGLAEAEVGRQGLRGIGRGRLRAARDTFSSARNTDSAGARRARSTAQTRRRPQARSSHSRRTPAKLGGFHPARRELASAARWEESATRAQGPRVAAGRGRRGTRGQIDELHRRVEEGCQRQRRGGQAGRQMLLDGVRGRRFGIHHEPDRRGELLRIECIHRCGGIARAAEDWLNERAELVVVRLECPKVVVSGYEVFSIEDGGRVARLRADLLKRSLQFRIDREVHRILGRCRREGGKPLASSAARNSASSL